APLLRYGAGVSKGCSPIIIANTGPSMDANMVEELTRYSLVGSCALALVLVLADWRWPRTWLRILGTAFALAALLLNVFLLGVQKATPLSLSGLLLWAALALAALQVVLAVCYRKQVWGLVTLPVILGLVVLASPLGELAHIHPFGEMIELYPGADVVYVPTPQPVVEKMLDL